MSQSLLMNENMIADLTTRGYTIQPLLGAAEVHKLTQLHAETTPAVPSDYYVTAFGQDIAVRRRIFDEIKSIAEDAVARLVPGYRIVMASFVTKRAHSTAGRLPLHQLPALSAILPFWGVFDR